MVSKSLVFGLTQKLSYVAGNRMARLFMYVFAQFGKTDAMSFCLEVGGSEPALHNAYRNPAVRATIAFNRYEVCQGSLR